MTIIYHFQWVLPWTNLPGSEGPSGVPSLLWCLQPLATWQRKIIARSEGSGGKLPSSCIVANPAIDHFYGINWLFVCISWDPGVLGLETSPIILLGVSEIRLWGQMRLHQFHQAPNILRLKALGVSNLCFGQRSNDFRKPYWKWAHLELTRLWVVD